MIDSDHGETSAYTFFPLPAGRGIKLLRRVLTMAPSVLEAMSSAEGDPSGDDLGGLSGAVVQIAQVLADAGDDKFFKDLLFGCIRQDPTTGKGVKVPEAFDLVYQCNYGELFDAIYQVLNLNFKPALDRLVGKFKAQKPATPGTSNGPDEPAV